MPCTRRVRDIVLGVVKCGTHHLAERYDSAVVLCIHEGRAARKRADKRDVKEHVTRASRTRTTTQVSLIDEGRGVYIQLCMTYSNPRLN